MTGGAGVCVRTGRARRATGRLVPHPHKLHADPQQAWSSGISSVGSYAAALTFFMTEQPKVRANSHAFDASIGRFTEACFGPPNHALLSAA
jgi:hypothetical protein